MFCLLVYILYYPVANNSQLAVIAYVHRLFFPYNYFTTRREITLDENYNLSITIL